MVKKRVKPLLGKDNDFLRLVLPACSSGNQMAVESYLCDPRSFATWIGPHGRTMLWEAARKGKLAVVKLLLEEHSADGQAIGCYYRETRIEVSPWLVATLNGHAETAEYLASQKAGLDFRSACYLGRVDTVEDVLQLDPGAVNRAYIREHRWNGYKAWPLQYAIVGKQAALVERLLAAGAQAVADGCILFDALDTEQPGLVELLLTAGADPREAPHRAWLSPTFHKLAAKHGHRLTEEDVPPEKWPEIVDASRGNHNAPDDPQRVEELIQRGDDVNVRDYKGKTALHRASQAGFLAISKLLLKHGADLEARSDKGETPIFDAAQHGRCEQIKLLVSKGANLEARNQREETPVFAAVRGGQAAAIRELHKQGADLEAVNLRGKTPIEIAERSRKQGIEQVRDVLRELQSR